MKALAFVLVLALTATAGAQQYALPDDRLTPGDVLPVTAEQVCVRGYAGRAREQYAPFGRPKHRLTPEEAQRRKVLVRVERETYERVMDAYGIPRNERNRRFFVLDDKLPVEIGGLPGSAQNWWAQPTEESYVKDELENRVHDDACSGRMSLADAQALFRGRWTDGIERR